MVKRAIKILAGLVVVIMLAVPGAALLIDDDSLADLLQAIPGAAGSTDDIIARKRAMASTLANFAGDAFTSLDSVYLELFGTSSAKKPMNKVVIDLAPGSMRKPAAQPKPESSGALSPSQPLLSQPPPLPPEATLPQATQPPPNEPPVPAEREPVVSPSPQAKPEPPQAVARTAPRKAPVRTARKKTTPDPSVDQDHKRGLLFYKGIGVDKDFKKAAQWFKQAAKKGHAGAQYNLGIMSYLGQGVEQDYSQAAVWFEKAGDQDHAAAQYNLGFLFYEGKGVTKDDLQAFMWIDRSANLGDEKAVRARDTLQKALPKEIFK